MALQLLLIEDDDELRSEIGEYLRRRHHAVTALATIAEAHRLLDDHISRETLPDAIICDINLTDGDGLNLYLEFALRLSSCQWILMSGSHDEERLLAAGIQQPGSPAVTVVNKPISMRELNQILDDG